MRAWLLLLAVLATFQPFVQVASTEDITSRFFNAISTQQQLVLLPPASVNATHDEKFDQTLTNTNSDNLNKKTVQTKTFASSSSALTNAIEHIFSTTAAPSSTSLVASPSRTLAKVHHQNSDSEENIKNHNRINYKNIESEHTTTSDIVIEIKNIEVENNEVDSVEEFEARKIKKHFEHKAQHQKQMQQQLQHSKAVQQQQLQDNHRKLANTAENSVEIRTTTKEATTQGERVSDKSEKIMKTVSSEIFENIENIENSAKNAQAEATSDKMAVEQSIQVTSANANTQTIAISPHRHEDQVQQQSLHQEQQHAVHSYTSITSSSASPAAPTNPTDSTTALTSTTTHEDDASNTRSNDDSTSESDSEAVTDSNAELELDSNEPATYSNTELISEKAKPDPSTLVQIENSLLSLFNMKRPPKIDRAKIIIPEAMKKLYAQIMGHELDSVNIPRPGLLTKSANTVRSFTHQESKIDDRFPHHHRFRLYFDVKSIPTDEKLKAAELQLARDIIDHRALNPRLANRTRYQVLIYDITRVGIRGKREPSYLLLDNKMVRLNSTETLSLDVQPAVDRWLRTPKKNYGLLVEVRTTRNLKPAPHPHVRLRRSVNEPHEVWQHKQPLLFTYTDDGRHKARSIRDVSSRSKRAGHHRRSHRRKNSEEICRRHSLYVDFADVGWSDWIVAPPGYDAFYCHGKCPFPLAEHLNSTNHAVVQTLVNNINPGKVPKACCVPTQLESISMLYLNDQSTVVLKNYQDMTVVGCGCR